MNINTIVLCPDCHNPCTMLVKSQERTVRFECDKCGITEHTPEYNDAVVIE